MNKVNILTPDVIAKIAAGEAVDRPASVVKELLENAIDAGATRIEINLKDAGRELVHIKDNGSGISPSDLERIFQRHATSKISSIEDLEKLLSMGFRGEALYSIAAVSDVTLKTQSVMPSPKDNNTAWVLHVRGGIRQSLEPAAISHTGTDIKVAELFFNTPARRKFLKNNAAELRQVLNIVVPYTLIYPEKRFLLTHEGRTLLDLRPASSQLDRVAAALNLNMHHFLETDQEFVDEKIRVKMILGNINIQRPRRDLQFIFINGRPIESKTLSFNLNDVYKLILPPGVYGAFIANITLDSANVDVNIHPTKREVRLKDESRVISILRRVTEHQLMHKGSPRHISVPNENNMSFPNENNMSFPNVLIGNPEKALSGPPIKTFGGVKTVDSLDDDNMRDFLLFGEDNTLRSKFTRARFIGSFLQKFLIFETDESLLIVDQHAAQERIMYEKFKDQIESAQVESQPLLTPLLLKLTPQEKLAWEELNEKLILAGIETTQFDDDTIAVQTQPLLLKNIENVVRTLLAEGKASRIDHDTLARRACKASIVAGDRLDMAQAAFQRKQLLECKDPFICPHGRPTLIEVTQGFLDRQFLRT